ncbi:MAG: RNA polymerase subunit sigma-70, partial [Anaerolineae bacterium]
MSEVATRIAAARAGDQHEFSSLTEPYRRELQVHCYRILGSLQDAEDLVQETLLRAWRRIDTYEGRASLRAWLYKIATNACLDALDKYPRRALPATTHPISDPSQPPAPPAGEAGHVWLEPLPDDLLAESATGPEARYAMHESVTLAFLAALQVIPPRQRVVLILRDVLDWRASEVAELLDLTVSAVNSALHRARTTLARHYHTGGRDAMKMLRSEDSLRALLDRYVHAWESADVDGLTALLKEDATLNMPPSPSWYRGRTAIQAFFASYLFSGDARGRWRLQATRANAQPAFALYQLDETGGVY